VHERCIQAADYPPYKEQEITENVYSLRFAASFLSSNARMLEEETALTFPKPKASRSFIDDGDALESTDALEASAINNIELLGRRSIESLRVAPLSLNVPTFVI
jgi:hypothetical protein